MKTLSNCWFIIYTIVKVNLQIWSDNKILLPAASFVNIKTRENKKKMMSGVLPGEVFLFNIYLDFFNIYKLAFLCVSSSVKW